MDKKTIGAIKASIKHWEKDILTPLATGKKIVKDGIVEGLLWKGTKKHLKIGHKYCALCREFYSTWDWDACNGCPLKTCDKGSSYDKFFHNPNITNAKAMIRKLKSLLPKGER